jgi:hypothetical protein
MDGAEGTADRANHAKGRDGRAALRGDARAGRSQHEQGLSAHVGPEASVKNILDAGPLIAALNREDR